MMMIDAASVDMIDGQLPPYPCHAMMIGDHAIPVHLEGHNHHRHELNAMIHEGQDLHQAGSSAGCFNLHVHDRQFDLIRPELINIGSSSAISGASSSNSTSTISTTMAASCLALSIGCMSTAPAAASNSNNHVELDHNLIPHHLDHLP
jgi:hypothetical protein